MLIKSVALHTSSVARPWLTHTALRRLQQTCHARALSAARWHSLCSCPTSLSDADAWHLTLFAYHVEGRRRRAVFAALSCSVGISMGLSSFLRNERICHTTMLAQLTLSQEGKYAFVPALYSTSGTTQLDVALVIVDTAEQKVCRHQRPDFCVALEASPSDVAASASVSFV